jgi:hypothetical protein
MTDLDALLIALVVVNAANLALTIYNTPRRCHD